MFNPHQFVKQTPSNPLPSGRIVLDRMADHSKSRWDEPLTVPDVLYLKFRLPPIRQSPKYPLSLVDYIRKAYDRCRDDAQTRLMENELRLIISKHEDSLHSIDWEQMPLPATQEQRKNTSVPVQREPILKKEAPQLPKEYAQNMVSKAEEEEPSKAKQKVSKTLQKLQEKLSRREEGRLEQQQTKMFIGFQNEPERYKPQIYQSQISPALRVIMNPPPPPKKEPIIPERQQPSQLKFKTQINKNIDQKNAVKGKETKILNVVTSTQPESIADIKKADKRQQGAKGKGRVVVTRKELNDIAKAAENRGELQQVVKRWESFNRLNPQAIKHIQQVQEDVDDEGEAIVGKSTCISKPYLRITGRPDPDSVRPEPVLRLALAHFLAEHRKAALPYDALLSQFKSIRQDLTVQHIRSSLTVEVYEQNFKMSLFQYDVIQVRHCQANLWELYREGHYSTIEIRDRFISYHFLILILEEKYKELEYMLTLLPSGTLEHPDIQHSLTLKRLFLLGNYRAFFDYYNSRDQVCRQLLNLYADKVRMKCLVMFCKTGGEKITIAQLAQTVGQDEDVLEALAIGEGAVMREGFFMLKESYDILSKSEFLVVKKVTNLLC